MTQIGTACGDDGTGSWQLIIANSADQTFTALVQVQAATSADMEATLVGLETFAVIGDPGTVPSSSAPMPTEAAGLR